jgi:mRNA-degrading endonuclease YafQ of YafQ-DinJ toxin-antitoxin module
MSKVIVSNKFKRAFRKFTRRNTQLQARIEKAIAELSDDVFNPSLGTHKLSVQDKK